MQPANPPRTRNFTGIVAEGIVENAWLFVKIEEICILNTMNTDILQRAGWGLGKGQAIKTHLETQSTLSAPYICAFEAENNSNASSISTVDNK